jgi:hypothetical protein
MLNQHRQLSLWLELHSAMSIAQLRPLFQLAPPQETF